ncbi:Adenylate and Guanylate cyclase catalytic domain containing protein [Tritrichomonas foetus]|uniref:Adenylate and Guanylate cyclase catalytic domain containing protein n=1 Tax=Tritrichomonas foetus TaxID=1144522 RepID=A0A1J4L1N5_9EUKA|nr:Adenylate and Guanylate cyclase catalytic domain containing protein [Tritrichomonas foetus]|eukprot:OHT17347.1 Adenylate and Guanylate cyclase catalytic domain containing protein [Tritrichomonas foetus]
MKGAGASSLSSESAVLHKLGFNINNNTRRIFAKCINRLRSPNGIIPAILEAIVFLQMLAVGFVPTIGCLFETNEYAKILATVFKGFLDLSSVFLNEFTGNLVIFCIFAACLVIWIVCYFSFAYKYRQTQTFSQMVLKFLLYFGYYFYLSFIVVISTNIGYFLRPMFFRNDDQTHSFISFIAILLILGDFALVNFMTRSLQSSPDINIKNKTCLWPQNVFPLLYRSFMLLSLPLIFELMRLSKAPSYAYYIMNIVAGIIGNVIIWVSEANIFPQGKAIMCSEYFVLALASIISLIFSFVGGNSLYYLIAFIVLTIIFAIVVDAIANKITRKRVDHLYYPFEELMEIIKTPKQCINYIKIGVIFNVPCVSNQTLLNWAVSRWPNSQELILVVSYIEFIWRYPYRDILELVSAAIDIENLNDYDSLLFYQIFSRLPTKEVQLLRRLDGVKRLYDLPITSLKHFWAAISNHQWDEVVLRSKSFHDDIVYISQIFSNLIFENPSSDTIVQEFIHFCSDIQGNHALANAAKRELAQRQALQQEESEVHKGENESMQQFSKLSSVHSSIFFSDFSEGNLETDKAQHSIQAAVVARPIYSPERFFEVILILSVISMASVIAVYVVAQQITKAVDQKVTLAGRLHNMCHIVTEILCVIFEFAAHGEKYTASGEPFNETVMRSRLEGLCVQLDDVISEVLVLHRYLEYQVLQSWTTAESEALLVSPIEVWPANISIITALRLYHLKARTIGFTPLDGLGRIDNPSSELIEVPNLYQSVIDSIVYILQQVNDDFRSKMTSNKNIVVWTSVACFAITLVSMLIGCPIIIYSVMVEFDFFLTIYGSISPKVVHRILHKESSKTYEHEIEQESITEKLRQQKKSLPLKFYKTTGISILFAIVAFVTVIPVVIIIISFFNHNEKMIFIINGLQLSIQIVNNLGIIALSSFRCFTQFPSPNTVLEERAIAYQNAESMLSNYIEIYFGTSDLFPTGLVFQDTQRNIDCHVVVPNEGINGMCSPFHETIYSIYNLVQMLVSFDETNASAFDNLGSIWWTNYYASANSAISTGISEFYDLFVTLSYSEKDKNKLIILIGFIIGWILFAIDIIVSYFYMLNVLKPALSSLLKPIMVMPADTIADSGFLMRFLQGDFDAPSRKTSLDTKRSTGDSTVPLIDFIMEGVLVMNPDGTIIASNKKYHEMMANTAEEVLGVNIRNVMPSNIQQLIDGLDRIKSGKPQQNVSIETLLFTEDARELNVRITLISNNDPNYKMTCAFIISDRSDLIKAQAQLRREKQNVEELLDSILPHNIAVSLLNGQNEISFEVERACILFSDIVSFTPMCSNMTAKQIMNTLNHLFTEFDTELGKFTRVTKLKTIGDAYVCAAGIFEGDGPLEEACKEIVTFAIRMQEIIPQVNEKLKTNMHMRIGIHTDGPLICGVLGKEKPLFEVIGNAVTLAEDLEAASLPDKIHVAKITVDLIQSLKLRIEERGGDVTVHGIEPPTYIVDC